MAMPSGQYLALYSSDPSTDAGTELSGAGYARVAVTFTAPVNDQTSNSNQIIFPSPTGAWGLIGWLGIRDAITGGNLLFSGSLTTPQAVVAGVQLDFPAGQIIVNLTK
jgi:hypothetical protein